MPRRMPVLGQHHMLETVGQAVNDVDHLIAAGHRETASGTEVILHIDDDQNVGFSPHDSPQNAAMAAAQPLKAGNLSTMT